MSNLIKVFVLKEYKEGSFKLNPNTIIDIDYKIAEILEKGGFVTYDIHDYRD